MEPDVRIRIRSRIIRIHVGEACIRTIIRIRGRQRRMISDSHFFSFFALRDKAEAETEVRNRIRSRSMRSHVGEARKRTISRIRGRQRRVPSLSTNAWTI